jgi:hypothetical protein
MTIATGFLVVAVVGLGALAWRATAKNVRLEARLSEAHALAKAAEQRATTAEAQLSRERTEANETLRKLRARMDEAEAAHAQPLSIANQHWRHSGLLDVDLVGVCDVSNPRPSAARARVAATLWRGSYKRAEQLKEVVVPARGSSRLSFTFTEYNSSENESASCEVAPAE